MTKLLQPLLKQLPSQASQQAQALIHSPPIPFHALHLHERKLLGPLVQLLRHKDDAVRHQSLYVLLECVRSSPLGMAELVDTPNCMQALVHLLTAGVQGPASAQASAVTAAHVLWNLSSDVGVRALMHKHTPSLGKVFFGLLDHASVHMRAAGSGALYNLASSIGQVARELPVNTQLVAFLVSMLGKDKDWRQAPQTGSQQQAEQQQQQQQQDLLQGRLGRLYIDANLGGGGPQRDMAYESEVLVEAHAAGLLSILVQSNAQAQLLLSLEGGIEQVLLGLQVTASSPILMHASAQLRDTCGRVLMGLLCHASTRISTTTSHMLLTHAVCLESEAAQLVCGNASIRRGMADALAAAALALGVPKQEVASSLVSLPQGAPDPPLFRASFEVSTNSTNGEAAVSTDTTAEGKAAALQQEHDREEGGSESGGSKRWQVLNAKVQGSDPLERLQVGQDVMYMLHVLVADEECARALAAADYGIVHMLRLMAYLDMSAAQRSATPALSTTSNRSSTSAVPTVSGASRQGTELGMPNAGSQQALQKLAASTEAVKDDQVLTGIQGLAAGTLAHLADFEAIRQLPSMQQALSPEAYQLTALAVLMLPQPEPSKPPPSTAASHRNGQQSAAESQPRDNLTESGGSIALGTTSSERRPVLQPNPVCVQGIHLQGMLAMLLAAVAQHGPFAYATFTSVLLQAPGSLGVILSLLPSPKDRAAATQAKWPPSAPLSTRTRPFSSGSAAGSSIDAGVGPKLHGGGPGESMAKPAAGTGERDRASAIKRNSVPDLWVSDYQLALSLLTCPRLDMGRPWLVCKPASMLAALKLCCVAAAGSRDVAWVLASKTPLVPSTLTLLMGKSQVMDLWHYSGLSPADWQYSLQHWGLGVLKALVTSLDDAQAYDQVALKADLVPTLLHSLHSPSPVVCVDALELLEALLGHTLCGQVLEDSSYASKLVVQLMLMAGMLEPANSSDSLGSALQGSRAPIRLQAACLTNRRKANSPNKGNKQCTKAQASAAQQQEQACVASVAASVLHLMAASAEPPYNVTLGHLAGVPHAMEALVEQIGLLATKLATPCVRALDDEVDQLRHLTGLAAEACLKGVMPPLLPHPPPCPLLDITQHTARLQTSSGRSPPNHDGQRPTRTGTSSARHGSSHTRVGSVLPGPAGDALRCLAHVASVLDVVSECAGALLHAVNHEGVVELMPQVFGAADERNSNQHVLWPETLSARAAGTGHTPGLSRMPSGWSAAPSADHPSVNGPSPLGFPPHNANADTSVAPTYHRPPRAALESICHDSLVILHRLLMFWSLDSPTVLASHLEGVHKCLYQGSPLRADSLGWNREPGLDGGQSGINGVSFPLPPPFGSNPTRRLALIAEICGEGLVRTSSVAVQRAAAHCLNATVALHPDLAKFILATLPKVRSNAMDVMMAAVVRMGGGDSGATQEHRVELALAALAAASGSANLKRIAGTPSKSLLLPLPQQRQRQSHLINGACSGVLKLPGGTDGAQLKGKGAADAEDPENPLLDDLMSYAEVMVASFDAVRRLLLAAPKDKTALMRPALVKDANDSSQQYYQFSRQGVNGGGVGSRATPQQGIQKRRYVREVLANKPFGSMDATNDARNPYSMSYAGVPTTHQMHAWREDLSWGLQGLGGAPDEGIGEQQLAKALDLMLEEDTLSQLQAMLEAVWAQQRDAWALCVGQLRRALDHHNQQLRTPVETRRLPQGDSFKGKAQSGNLKQPPGSSGANQAASQQHSRGGRGFYKCSSWDGFRLEAEDSAGWARISDALQRVAAASAAAAANVPPDLRLVAAEVVVAAAPLAQKPLIGRAGGLLRGLGSVLAEPFSGAANTATGTASNANPPVTLAATHMMGEGSSGRSVGDAVVLRLQERQQKVLVLQALWSLCRTPGGPQAISISGAAGASAAPSGNRSRRASPANHMATNNAVSTGHGHGNTSNNSGGSPGSAGGKTSVVGVPVLPGLVSLIVQVQDHGLKAHAAGVIATVSSQLDPSLLATIGGTAGLAAGLVAVVTNLVPVLTKVLFTANGVRTPSPSSYAGPTHSPPPLPRTASPGMGSAYGPEGPDFNTIEAQALACIMALAALAELCRSAPVAARVATLKGLPAALAAALRIHSMDMCLYAAGLAGNLLSHTASQAATITAARGTLSKDLVKCLKVFCTAPHPSTFAPPSTSPAAHTQQPAATEGPNAADKSLPGYPATAPGGVGSTAFQSAHANAPQPASGSSQGSAGSAPGVLEPVDRQEALLLLLGALRNLASCEQGRAEMANDSATVPLLLCILRQEPWQVARPNQSNQSKMRTLKEQRRYDVNMGPVMEPYRPSDATPGEHTGTAARGRAGEGGPHASSSPPRAQRTFGMYGQVPGGLGSHAGSSHAAATAEAGEGGGMLAGGQQHLGSRGTEQQLQQQQQQQQEPMYRPHIQVLAASVLANLSVDRGSQEAFVADADLVIRALLDVLSCAVIPPSRSLSSTGPSASTPSTPQTSNVRRPSKMSPMSALQESMSARGTPALHDRGRIAHNRAPSDGFTRGAPPPALLTSASGSLAMSASGVQSSAVQLSLDSGVDGQLSGSRMTPGGGAAELPMHSSMPALRPSNGAYSSPFGNGPTAVAGLPAAKETAAAGSGADAIPIPENPAEASQLQCYIAVALSNAMSHAVLARAALTHVRTVPLLCALIMRIPCPGDILEAASASPQSLNSLRRSLEGWGRLVSVAALRALQQLLSSVGPRAVQQLRAPKPGEALPTSVRSHSKLPSMVPGSAVKDGPLPGTPTAASMQASLGAAGISVAGLPPTPTLKQLLDKTVTLLDWVNYYDLEEPETAGGAADGRPSSQQNNSRAAAAAGPGLSGAAAALLGACACYSIPMEYEAYVGPALPCLVRLVQLPIMQSISQAMHSPAAGAAVPMLPRPPQMGGAAAGGGGLNPLEGAAAHATAALWALVSNPACAPWAVKVAADADAVDSMLAHCAWGQHAGSGAGGTRARFSAHRLFSAATLGHLAVLRGHTVPTCLHLLHTLLLQDGPAAHGVVGALVDLATLAIPQVGAQASQEGGGSLGAARQQQQQQQQQRRGAPRPGRGRPGAQDIERSARGDALALVGAPQDVACMLGLQAAGTLSCLASSSARVACTSLAWPGVQPVMLALLRSGHQDSKLAGVTLVGALAGPGIGTLTAGTTGAAAAEAAVTQGKSNGTNASAAAKGSSAEGARSGAQGTEADTGKGGQVLQGNEQAANPTAVAGGAQAPSILPGATAFVVTDAPEHEDGAQAARWALLGYGKDGSRPSAGSLGVDPIKGVPEKGAELLHTLLSTCIGGCVSAGTASPALWGSREEALVVASAAVAVADLALEEDVAVLLATANMRSNGGDGAATGIAGVNRAKPPLARPDGKDARMQRAAVGEAGTAGLPTDAAAANPHGPTAQAGLSQPNVTHLQQQQPAFGQPGVSGGIHAVAAPLPGPLAIVDVLVRLLMVPFNMVQQQQQLQPPPPTQVYDHVRAHNVAYLSSEPGRGTPSVPKAAADQGLGGSPALDLPVAVRAEAMRGLNKWPPLGASQLPPPGGPTSAGSSRQHAQHEQQGAEHGSSSSMSSSSSLLAGNPTKPHGLDSSLPPTPNFNLSLANQSLLKKRQQLEAQRATEVAAKFQADVQLAAVAAAAAAGALQNVLSWPHACNALLSHPSVLPCVEKALLAMPSLQHHALTPPAIHPNKAPSTALQTHHITLATLNCCLLGCVANFAALEEGRNKVLLRHPILEVLVTSLGEGSPSNPPPAPQPIRGSAPLLKGPHLPSTIANGKASTFNTADGRASTVNNHLEVPAGGTQGSPFEGAQDPQEQCHMRQHVQQQQQQQASVALGAISNLLMILPSGDGLQLSPPAGPLPTSLSPAANAGHGAHPLLSKDAAAANSVISGWHPIVPTIPHYIPEDREKLVVGRAGELARQGGAYAGIPPATTATGTTSVPPNPSLQATRAVPKPPSPASQARATALACRAGEGGAAEGVQARQQQGSVLEPPLLGDKTLGGQYKVLSGRSVLLNLMRQRQEVPGTLRTLSLAPRHSPGAAQKPPPTQPSSSPAPAPNPAAFPAPRQHASQSGRVPPPQPLVVPMVSSVSMPAHQMQTLSEDARGNGRGGWGEAIREVAHMAAWVMRQVDSSTHGRP